MALFLPMPGNHALAAELARLTRGTLGRLETRRFPDGESYVRLRSDVAGTDLVIVCTLARPDGKFLPLSFAAAAGRELGALRVRLIAPYLAYMRQDARFRSGEAVTSRAFAGLLSNAFDELVTVDPHLHRHSSLSDVYRIETRAVSASPLLARWIADNVEDPLLVGPDAESEQWVREIARLTGAPWTIFRKQRRGDEDVALVAPELRAYRGRQPVLVDDIVSSGVTLRAAASTLVEAGFTRPVCLAVHALHGRGAATALAGVTARVVTTDTVRHRSNGISIAPLIASALGPSGEAA